MNNKRSYLDTLNEGRQRRPHTTLEQLNRSLETLEQRLDRSREETSGYPHPEPRYDAPRYSAEPRYAAAQPYAQRPVEEPRQATRAPEEPRGYQRPRNPAPAAPAFDHNYQALARDIDRVRGQEDGVAAVGKIAGELRGLREELRHQMTAGLHREFDALRKDIERAFQSNPAAKGSAELGLEFERLSGAIHTLAEKSDDRNVNMLRLELEQVKSALDTLAREESVQRVDSRWDDFDRRWTAFEDRVDAERMNRTELPGLSVLTDRLEQISAAVNNLPESLSLRSLEDKVRTLAGAVDHFVSQQSDRGGQTFGMIDERLDEISRAIVASTVAAQANNFDAEPFDRIEQRIASLARQIEEVAEDRPTGELMDRLNMLSVRVDDIASRAHLPEQAMERLGQQIAMIADRIDRGPAVPDMDHILHGMEQRFDVLSGMIERRQGDALEQGNMLFRDLERRLDEVADRLDQRMTAPAMDGAGIMEAIDARFTAMAKRMETRPADTVGETAIRGLENRLEQISSRLDAPAPDLEGRAAIRGLESRLENISSRLDTSAAHVAGIDPGLIRSLEAQVSGLSAHLSKPGTPLPDFEDIAPRLETIEKSLNENRDTILEAARKAAESAVRQMKGSEADTAAVAGLAQDLKQLETLTRRSDERNSKTFEAIHDTLLKIVDRLGSLETSEYAPPAPIPAPISASVPTPAAAAMPATAAMAAAPKITVQDTPSMDIDAPLPLGGGMANLDGRAAAIMGGGMPSPRSPAEAAVAAALDAIGSDAAEEKDEQATAKKSMFGGLARAFGGKKETAAAPALAGSAPAVEAPSVDLDEPLDPKAANRPLKPGSGAPDLGAIMKRVRDERGQPTRQGEIDPTNNDFIAAARRNAQAAAAEAEVLKRQATMTGGPVKALRIGDLLKARRKPILMAAAAIMMALAGLQLGKAFLSDPAEMASTDVAPIVSEQNETAAASAAGEPAKIAEAADANAAPVRVIGQPAPSDGVTSQNAMAAPSAEMPAESEVPAMAPQASSPDERQAGMEPATPKEETTGAVPPANMDAASANPAANVPAASENTSGEAAPVAKIAVPEFAGPAALRDAAAGGDPKALFEIGSRLANPETKTQDLAAAAKFYEKSAELGFAPAEYRIGNLYEKGTGVARDVPKAKTWYQLAAAQGNASAMHNLAVLFAMGADGVTDNESAARWFQAAADLGVKDSQFNLGILAAKGVGMPQNLEESYKWFALVAKTGDKDAAAKRDEIANALRPEQLEKARAATELWKAKPLDPASNSIEIPDAWQDKADTTASIDMKKAVKNIQLILNKNGYDAGGADGVMGQKTKDAIKAFQNDHGLKATGEVDQELVKELLARK